MPCNLPAPQLDLELPRWGGARRGAGRKAAPGLERLPHAARDAFSAPHPVHVTLRVREHVWNLRSQRSYAVIHRSLASARRRAGFAVTHLAIQGNHLHLVVEADGSRVLANGVRALSISVARGLNRLMGRTGPVFRDRYHAHVLRTPAEVRNATAYVLGNHASHARRRGEPLADGFVDPFSSASGAAPRVGQLPLWPDPVTRRPATWLLRTCAG